MKLHKFHKCISIIYRFLFALQESETGLYVSLISFYAFGKDYVDNYFKKTGHSVFLHIQREKKEVNIFVNAISLCH